jgi:hypothetical protein
MADKQVALNRLRSSQISTKGGALLDDSDQNIGNAAVLVPYPDPNALVAVNTPITNPPRIIFLDALSPTARTATIALTASTILNPPDLQTNAGPITGIVEFGNGAQFTRIEVDIPIGPTRGFTAGGILNFIEPEDGVTLVTVPAGTLRVYGRNDSKLIVPNISGEVGDIGVGGTPPVGTALVPFANSVLAKVFATYFTTRTGWLQPTKTNVIGRTASIVGSTIIYTNSPGTAFLIPPLAKRFRVLRVSGAGTVMAAVTGTQYTANGTPIDLFSIAAGVSSPWFDISGIAHRIGLSFTLSPAGIAALLFEIGA